MPRHKEDRTRDLEEQRKIAQRIRLARTAKHMTLDQVAEKADISTQFLSQLERGEQSATMLPLAHLSTALGVSADYLLKGHEPAPGLAALAADYLATMNPIERDILSRTVVSLRELLDTLSPES